jgi:hypothetical protein
VIRHHFNWQRASMAAGLCYGSRGGGAQLAFHHQVGAYDTTTLIGALEGLRRFLGGQKATLVWDGLPPTAATRRSGRPGAPDRDRRCRGTVVSDGHRPTFTEDVSPAGGSAGAPAAWGAEPASGLVSRYLIS